MHFLFDETRFRIIRDQNDPNFGRKSVTDSTFFAQLRLLPFTDVDLESEKRNGRCVRFNGQFSRRRHALINFVDEFRFGFTSLHFSPRNILFKYIESTHSEAITNVEEEIKTYFVSWRPKSAGIATV